MWGGLLWLFRHGETEGEEEREADFFDPVQWPTMEQVEIGRLAREYSEQTTAGY